jgi:hypothetical protein
MKQRFVHSLLALQRRSLVAGLDFATAIVSNTMLDVARDELANIAVRDGATHVLWLDTDMVFPPDALDRLLAHDLPIVGANYRTRQETVKESSACVNGKRMAPRTEGLEEAVSIGLGLCLMKAEVFHGLAKPWFAMIQAGEDAHFFLKLFDQKGVRPVVDHKLSAEVGHVSETVLML